MSASGLALSFIASAAAAWIFVGALRRFAERRAILDRPNERSSHSRPTPRGGGIAIVVLTLTGSIAMQLLRGGWTWTQMTAYAAASAVVSAVSWADDLRGVNAAVRFSVHAAAASAAVLVFGCWKTLHVPHLGVIALGGSGVVLTFIWITGLTNAYNFMDGIDGIAGLQAVVAGIAFAAMAGDHHPFTAFVAILIAGSSLGFLCYNWQPASIFMGDVGSAFIGYSFATLALSGSSADVRLAFAFVLPLWPFVFDSAFTFVRRLLRRERVFSAHRSHLYQRLNQTGLSHAAVTALYGTIAALNSMCGLAITRHWLGAEVAGVTAATVSAGALWVGTVVRERRVGTARAGIHETS